MVSLIGIDILDRLAAQVQYVLDIVRYLDEGRELWLMDETGFNLGMQQSQVWMDFKNHFRPIRVSYKRTSHTVIGAISNKSDRLVYQVLKGTRKETVMGFL